MLKKIVISSVLVTLILSLTGLGCLPGQGEEEKKEEITLTIWRLFDDEEVFAPIIKDFQTDYKHVKINYVKKDYTEYEEKTVDALAADEGPDIWMVKNDWMPRHYKKLTPMPDGLLSEKTQKSDLEIYKDTYAPVAANDSIIDDKIYGVPLSVDTLALLYNTDIFREERRNLEDQKKIGKEDKSLEDPPATWEEVIKYTKLLTKKEGDKISRAGIALGTANNVAQATDILYALMLQNNTSMISSDKKSATFNLSSVKQTGEPVYPGTQALDFYTSFANPKKETYSWNNSMPNSVEAFKQGKTAMIIDYAYQKNKIEQDTPNLNFQVAPLPQIKGVTEATDYASYWIETVTKKCQHPEMAWRFLTYAASRGLRDYTQATKRPSPLKVKPDRVPEVTKRVENKASTFDFQVNSAKSWYKGRYPKKVDQASYDMIENVIVHGQPLQTAIDTAAAQVTKLLQEE